VLDQTELANPSSGVVSGMVSDAVGFLSGSILGYVRGGGKLFIEGASVVVMALYLARQPAMYRDGLISLFSPRQRAIAVQVFDDTAATLRAWLVGQLIAMAVLASLTAIGLLMLGVPYWLAFGIFTGLVAVVPFFGTLVSTLLPALFMVASGDWLKVLLVLVLGVLVHVFEANVVVPRIMQRKVELPPVLTIASVLVMGTLLGAIGLIVAVPVLCVSMVLIRHILHGEIYGEPTRFKPAVLRPTEAWSGVERRKQVAGAKQ
jgi:predicted PurR-regulated permease PerM